MNDCWEDFMKVWRTKSFLGRIVSLVGALKTVCGIRKH
jgi:hypothetical protein